ETMCPLAERSPGVRYGAHPSGAVCSARSAASWLACSLIAVSPMPVSSLIDVSRPMAALQDMVDSSNLRASAARERSCGVKANGWALPFQRPMTGVAAARFPVTASSATPAGADSHLEPLHTSASTPHC